MKTGRLAVFLLICSGPARARENQSIAVKGMGRLLPVQGRSGVVVTAPHGTADVGTPKTFWRVIAATHASGILATGFVSGRVRVNVNRPTEQTFTDIIGKYTQKATPRAAYANEQFESWIKRLARGPVHYYFELHDNEYPDLRKSIEVATGGVTREEAIRLKQLFEQVTAEHFASRRTTPLQIHVEPLTPPAFVYRSTTASSFVEKGFLIEIPIDANMELYGAILGETIARFLDPQDDPD